MTHNGGGGGCALVVFLGVVLGFCPGGHGCGGDYR